MAQQSHRHPTQGQCCACGAAIVKLTSKVRRRAMQHSIDGVAPDMLR